MSRRKLMKLSTRKLVGDYVSEVGRFAKLPYGKEKIALNKALMELEELIPRALSNGEVKSYGLFNIKVDVSKYYNVSKIGTYKKFSSQADVINVFLKKEISKVKTITALLDTKATLEYFDLINREDLKKVLNINNNTSPEEVVRKLNGFSEYKATNLVKQKLKREIATNPWAENIWLEQLGIDSVDEFTFGRVPRKFDLEKTSEMVDSEKRRLESFEVL